MKKESPKKHFTIGIEDDVTHLSLSYDKTFSLEKQHLFRGLFFGLGADGTVSANKNSMKILGETTDNFVQGYFVYLQRSRVRLLFPTYVLVSILYVLLTSSPQPTLLHVTITT